jgi:DNA replication protein DnaC
MTMSETSLHELVRRVGLRLDGPALEALLKEATRAKRSPREVVELLCESERRARDARHMERRQRHSKLGDFVGLDAFDWSHPKSIDRALYEDLLTMDFVARHANVLFRGSVGLGKTTLAKNLGQRALERGYTVRFTTLASMLADVARPDSPMLQARRLRHYTRPDVLIVDEIGYLPFDARAGDVFYNVIAGRHEQRSTIATTNLPFKAWGAVLGDAASVVALIDRFSENLSVMDIEGETARGRAVGGRAVNGAKSRGRGSRR